jgi:hypothetical protein
VDRPLLVLLTVALSAVVVGCGSAVSRPRRNTERQVSFLATAPPASDLPASAAAAMRLERGKARRVGAFEARSGEARGIWVAPTQDGNTCVLDVGADRVGGGCGPTLFGGRRLAFTEASEGGPVPEPETLVRIAGIAAPGVAAVRIEFSDGSSAEPLVNDGGAFVYEETAAQLAAGVTPAALVALDGAARQVDRIDLPPPALPAP